MAIQQLKDNKTLVRIRAAELLGALGHVNPNETLYSVLENATQDATALEALNTMVYLEDTGVGINFKINKAKVLSKTNWLINVSPT